MIPGLEFFACKQCSSEINVLRSRQRTRGNSHKLTRAFSDYYPKQKEFCECRQHAVEVDLEGRLIVYTDTPDQLSLSYYDQQGLKLTIVHDFTHPPSFDSPPLESYHPKVYENDPWEIQMKCYINMDEYKPSERPLVLPATDADRQFFLRQYAYTYKVVIFEDGYVYLPSGHRKAQRTNPYTYWNGPIPEDEYKQYLDPRDHPRSYPEHLITNLHILDVKTLRLELETIQDPFHMANLTLNRSKTLRTP